MGYLSISTIKNRFCLTMTSFGENSCRSNLKNALSFFDNAFSSLIQSASVAYITFNRCLSLNVYVRTLYFASGFYGFLGAVMRPSQKLRPHKNNTKIKSPMISPNQSVSAF